MDEKQATTKRLDLAPEAVAAAKRAYVLRAGVEGVEIDNADDLEQVHFRAVLDYAVQQFAGRLQKELLKVGLVRREKLQHRQRPVTIETWDGVLEEMSKRYDLSKIQVIRCLLEMLAASQDQQAPLPPEE
jgi:hypothetical protein